jgi:DNA-binding CsgD family transcriptional regulator
MNRGTRKPPTLGTPLSKRELEVLGRVAQGDTNPQVGKALNLSRDTVKTHLGRVMGKLGARTRVDAVRIAIEQELLPRYGSRTHGVEVDTSSDCGSTLDNGEQVCARKGTHAVHRSPDGKFWSDNASDQAAAATAPTVAQVFGDVADTPEVTW